jgi:hypothetical protein
MTHLHPLRQECALQLPQVAQIEERDRKPLILWQDRMCDNQERDSFGSHSKQCSLLQLIWINI